VIAIPDYGMAFEFLQEKLSLHWSADFRGVLFVPDEFDGCSAKKDDVGVAYGWNKFIGRTCMISIVVQKKECLTRAVVKEAFRFPFENGMESVLAAVDSTNLDSMELCRRAGFKHKTTVENGGMEGDLVIWEMRRGDCPWFRKEH
jgi:RimJ/RimL family protein N-acetyltransferase